jgi:hypothetical protein
LVGRDDWSHGKEGADMSSSLLAVVVDCRDPRAQAAFWAKALSSDVVERNTDELLAWAI